MRNSFNTYERLKRKKQIDTLFRIGKAFSVFPLRVVHLLTDRTEAERSPARAGFSVPKKKFKKSVTRNRLKRLMREAWRTNKHDLYQNIPLQKQLHVFFIFTDDKPADYDFVKEAMIKAVKKLSEIHVQ